ncbi:MAG: exodeoxyribonuclease III [Myxococcales bacterium]|nr:exodeoxyribonuclease III [Myxococcales bacterium]
MGRVLVATWNVNSIRARLQRVLAWIERRRPDVLCLQELKCTDDEVPRLPFEAAGYRAAIWGQKTYNGVAILSNRPLVDVERGFGDGEAPDTEARLLRATIDGVRVLCAYVPNGGEVGGPRWPYKLAWLERLERCVERELRRHPLLLLAGDLNVAPTDRDVAFPEQWRDGVLTHPEVRAAFARLERVGLVDVLRRHHPDAPIYTWWDYRALAFPRGDGMRIDHVLASAALASRSRGCTVDRDERKGKGPSDHVPVVVDLDVPPAT